VKKLLLILLLILATSAHATVDLLNPASGISVRNTTIDFEYYVSMQNLTNCNLLLNGQVFVGANVESNAINNIQVQSLPVGFYVWNISCTGDTTEVSITRNVTIDNQAPTVAIVTPTNGSTPKVLALDIIPNDNGAAVSCQVLWNAASLETVTVASNTHYAKNYTVSGPGTLAVNCTDPAGNSVQQTRTLTVVPDFSLQLTMSQREYGLSESPRLTINTMPGANVTIDICPDQPGFVQCTTALIDTTSFPQTVSLPYMNRSGPYIVDGLAIYAGQTKVNRTTYAIINSMSPSTSFSVTPKLNTAFNMTASVQGGVAPYRFVWDLNNGTRISDVSMVQFTHTTPGNYTQRLTVTDYGNNTRSINVSYVVRPVYMITIQASDNQTGAALGDVDLDITNEQTSAQTKLRTAQNGYAYFEAEEGVYRIFASALNYEYHLEEFIFNITGSIQIVMNRQTQQTPQVTILTPASNSTVGSPVSIKYTVTHTKPVNCTLYFGTDNWFTPNGSMIVSDSGAKEFVAALSPGSYRSRIECTDDQAHTGTSPVIPFAVSVSAEQTATAAPSEDEMRFQATIETLDNILANIDGYGPKEKEAIAALGFDKNLRNTKRAVQQAIRDINDLQYRKEFDENGKKAERKRIIDNVNAVIANTPQGLAVTDTKSFVRYVKEDDIGKVTAELAGLAGMSLDEKFLGRKILADQQKFTISTKLTQVEYLYPDQSVKTITLVTRSFTYAPNLSREYNIYEIIPKEVAKSSHELELLTKGDVLKDDPVIRFSTEKTISYIIPKRIDFTRVEDIKTVLAKPYAGEQSLITGFAIFSPGDIGGVDTWVIVVVVIFILAYLAYYFNLIKQIKYLIYNFGKHEKAHYLNVLINDARDNLDANNYEKAELIYREVRMSYDALPIPAKNELYDDVVELVHRMDSYYFNTVMIELDTAIKAGDLETAIQSYEKLTKIYERLSAEQQEALIHTVTAMAKRVGLAA
jgi:PKD repeat protein